jgi:hypothetical protein
MLRSIASGRAAGLAGIIAAAGGHVIVTRERKLAACSSSQDTARRTGGRLVSRRDRQVEPAEALGSARMLRTRSTFTPW